MNFIAVSISAYAAEKIEVTHTDGSVARYSLLPVRLDPSHTKEVEERISHSMAVSDLPDAHQIPENLLSPIRDQGDRNSCSYFMTLGLLETHYLTQSPSNQGIELSAECLTDLRDWMFETASYTGSDKPDARPDPDGDDPAQIALTLNNEGVPLAKSYKEAQCKYERYWTSGHPVSEQSYQSIFANGESSVYGKDVKYVMDTQPTIEAIKAMLAKNIPVGVSIVVYAGYSHMQTWNYTSQANSPDGDIVGGHAVMLVGYKTENGSTSFTFRNSWGKWGLHGGYGTMNEGLLEHSWSVEPDYDVTETVQ